MQFPLTLSFKIVALAPQISVTDAQGNLLFYVKQKLLKLKEAITVFADTQQTQPLYKMGADRIIDFSAQYSFSDTQGMALGGIKRKGLRSLWKAEYELWQNDMVVFKIHEENPWVKVIDALLFEIPIVGLFSGYLFNPAYVLSRTDGVPILRLAKQPAFFEGKFKIEKLGEMNSEEELLNVLGCLMMILLERARG